MSIEQEVLDFLNTSIREEHGNRVTLDSKWMDANVDSFGTTVIFLDLDEKYGCFGSEWFNAMTKEDWEQLPVHAIVERVQNESA